MAMYECFESFAAFERFLRASDEGLDPAARMLVSEYCRYALDRTWYYYPDALPENAVSDEQREANGYVDSDLSFPLEDLYPDGQKAGQVGQEIYGAGAAFIMSTRAFHDLEGVPLTLYCDHFLDMEDLRASANAGVAGDSRLRLRLNGGAGCTAKLSILQKGDATLPQVKVMAGGDPVRPHETLAQGTEFHVPADGEVDLSWV